MPCLDDGASSRLLAASRLCASLVSGHSATNVISKVYFLCLTVFFGRLLVAADFLSLRQTTFPFSFAPQILFFLYSFMLFFRLLALTCAVVILIGYVSAGTYEMITFAKYYCDKQVYNNGISRADNYGGDCAHFVARSIQAGGCLPGLSSTDDMWAFAAYTSGGVPYKLICVGGPNHCWIGGRTVGGLHEYLRAAGWIYAGTSFDAVEAACVAIGDPIGPGGPYAHSAFGIAHRRIAGTSLFSRRKRKRK